MNYKKIIGAIIILFLYIVMWGPIAYSGANLYTDMFFGDFVKNSQLALYWSYAFHLLLMVFITLLPVVGFYAMYSKSEETVL